MVRRLLLIALALLPAVAVAAPPDELRFIPPDAAGFLHLDLAALYDGKPGDTIKGVKAKESKEKLAALTAYAGLAPADLKSLTVASLDLNLFSEEGKMLTVVAFRKKYDAEKVIANLKQKAGKTGTITSKGDVVKVTWPQWQDKTKSNTVTTDLSDPTRIVSLYNLGNEYLTPVDAKKLPADIADNAGAVFLAGVNFAALPPAVAAPGDDIFSPLTKSERLLAVGTLTKDAAVLTVTLKAKDKETAAAAAKSLDFIREQVAQQFGRLKEQVADDDEIPKEVPAAVDALIATVKDAKTTTEGGTTTVKASFPLDTKLTPLVEAVTGGLLTSKAQMTNSLHQLGIAMHSIHDASNAFPPAATADKKGKKLLSWRVAVLPYIEQEALYKLFKLDEPWDSEHNAKVLKDNPMPKLFAIPGTTNEKDKKTHYQVLVGPGTVFEPGAKLTLVGITDGTSNTIMTVAAADAVEWTKPDDVEFDPKADIKKKLFVKGGKFMVGMGDGSVRGVSAKISDKTLKAAITRADGEVLGSDWDDK